MKINVNIYMRLTLFGFLLPYSAYGQENPHRIEYFNWNDATTQEEQAYKNSEPEREKCSEGIQDRIPRERAAQRQSCINQIVQEQVIPHAMFPDLVIKLHDEKLRIAQDYQDGKIGREEANQADDKAENEFMAVAYDRSEHAYNAGLNLECAAIYYNAANSLGEEDSIWAEQIAEAASSAIVTAIVDMRLAYNTELTDPYFESELFDSDLGHRVEERQAYWKQELRNESATFGKQMDTCKELLPEQESLVEFLNWLMDSEGI